MGQVAPPHLLSANMGHNDGFPPHAQESQKMGFPHKLQWEPLRSLHINDSSMLGTGNDQHNTWVK
jgi:hypothetical protein